MQTFLPSANMCESARLLDSKRLNKQILEAYQILKVLSINGSGWRNHPAVLMWKNSEQSLYTYALAMAEEAGIRHIKTDKNLANLETLKSEYLNSWGENTPSWFNSTEIKRITTTHKARLFVKNPVYYARFAASVDSEYNKPCCVGCNYYWPTHVNR